MDDSSHHCRLCSPAACSCRSENTGIQAPTRVLVHARLSSTEIEKTLFLERFGRHDTGIRQFVFPVDDTSHGRDGERVKGYSRRWSPFTVRSNSWIATTSCVLAAVDSSCGLSFACTEGSSNRIHFAESLKTFPDVWRSSSTTQRCISQFPMRLSFYRFFWKTAAFYSSVHSVVGVHGRAFFVQSNIRCTGKVAKAFSAR